jgi:hypothetical protein
MVATIGPTKPAGTGLGVVMKEVFGSPTRGAPGRMTTAFAAEAIASILAPKALNRSFRIRHSHVFIPGLTRPAVLLMGY